MPTNKGEDAEKAARKKRSVLVSRVGASRCAGRWAAAVGSCADVFFSGCERGARSIQKPDGIRVLGAL